MPYGIAFDVEKLTWEMNFFLKHFLEAYCRATLTPSIRTALSAELGAVVRDLAAMPRVLCHRDYHSRNLMLTAGRLHVIDFQDARLGPDTYDLASLVRDSYVDLPDQTFQALLDHYLAVTGRPGDAEAFRERFDLMSLQRNLKALGTFGYQTTARGNPVYVQYIPRTMRYARENSASTPDSHACAGCCPKPVRRSKHDDGPVALRPVDPSVPWRAIDRTPPRAHVLAWLSAAGSVRDAHAFRLPRTECRGRGSTLDRRVRSDRVEPARPDL